MTLRAALIGSGWVSLNRHLPALRANGVEVAGVIAPKESLDRAQIPKGLPTSSDPAAWTNEIDFVMIGTPPNTHTELVLQALRQGKHVLVEKPFAPTEREADSMIDLAAKNNLQLGVVHNLQFCRAATRAEQMLKNGELGELRGVVGLQSSNHRRRLPVWFKELPLGLYTDESPHLIYLALKFLGDAKLESLHVGARLADNDNTPDLVQMAFRNSAGVPGSVTQHFGGAVSEWAFTILGSKQTAVVDLFRDILIVLPDDGVHVTSDVLRSSFAALSGHVRGTFASGFKRVRKDLDYGNNEVVARFLRAVTSGDALGSISGDSGRAVVSVLDRAHAAR